MSAPAHIAVIDVGKTNVKLALVDADELTEIAVETRPNTVLPGPPYPHFDLEGHWAFILDHLSQFHKSHGIDVISVTTHGASAVLLDEAGMLAMPMLDYEHDLSATATSYDTLRPSFDLTGSPRLPGGLNLGAQLYWLRETQPDAWARIAHIVTYPQYWGHRLTGVYATDVTSLGCHTDLWCPMAGGVSPLVETLGLSETLGTPRKSSDILGTLTPEVAARTGLPIGTPVLCGIHDSNASLYPHLLARTGAFSVASTGTWVVAMAVGGETPRLDPARDTLINVNALGQPVPSARFMGGREYDLIRAGGEVHPTLADRTDVLDQWLMLLPAIEPGSGPFPRRAGGWTEEPSSDGTRMLALSWYLALMTDTCLRLISARGPTIIEGPFAHNPDYVEMLSHLRPDGVVVAGSSTGTSIGAALLAGGKSRLSAGEVIACEIDPALEAYAARWAAFVDKSIPRE
ncbi:MAG: FGGY-family carbohydrate kinase [Pseudomonadota bacterium]